MGRMGRADGSRVVELAGSTQAKESLADTLETLANGGSVVLGDFGDAGISTDADEQACLLREIADALRR
jgi:hypothetical protein